MGSAGTRLGCSWPRLAVYCHCTVRGLALELSVHRLALVRFAMCWAAPRLHRPCAFLSLGWGCLFLFWAGFRLGYPLAGLGLGSAGLALGFADRGLVWPSPGLAVGWAGLAGSPLSFWALLAVGYSWTLRQWAGPGVVRP
jgi:hypothetical protein